MDKRDRLNKINSWAKKNTCVINIRCNKTTDADIIKHLQTKRKATYIKRLIRDDIKATMGGE